MKKSKLETSDTSSDVGYGKPPKATRFRKGRSGNPKGRQRGDENLLSVFKRMVTKHEQHPSTGRGIGRIGRSH